jgi:PAS domain-containing protein
MRSVVGLDAELLYCSAASVGAFGWEPDSLVGKGADALMHPDHAPAVLAGRSERAKLAPVYAISGAPEDIDALVLDRPASHCHGLRKGAG